MFHLSGAGNIKWCVVVSLLKSWASKSRRGRGKTNTNAEKWEETFVVCLAGRKSDDKHASK